MIDTYWSKIIHMSMKTAFTRAKLNVMTQALHAVEGSLPQGLTIQNVYNKMCNGSRSVAVMVRNGAAYPQTLKKKIPVVRVVGANQVPEAQMHPGMIRHIGWSARHPDTKWMTMEQRQERAVQEVRLQWPRILAARAGTFSLFPPCWVPWHFFIRILWAWLYPFNWTCDKSHQ